MPGARPAPGLLLARLARLRQRDRHGLVLRLFFFFDQTPNVLGYGLLRLPWFERHAFTPVRWRPARPPTIRASALLHAPADPEGAARRSRFRSPRPAARRIRDRGRAP